MPDPNADLPASRALPPVVPLGGSKWAARFSGPREALVRGVTGTVLANATVYPDGQVMAAGSAEGPVREQTVIALPAGGAVSLGQFLTGPLNTGPPGAPAKPPAFCGAPLSPRQTDVLARLGRLRDYIPIETPQIFREVIVLPAPAGSVPGPGIRPIADQLRAPPAAPAGAVAILPIRATERFCLANRASLTAWLRAKKIAIIEPETLRLADLSAQLASASRVLLADPAQAGLLGLCHPGTKILEIAPEGWLGAEARSLCDIFGLDWTPFLAAAPSYPLQGALPFGSLVPCSYEIPIRDLSRAL